MDTEFATAFETTLDPAFDTTFDSSAFVDAMTFDSTAGYIVPTDPMDDLYCESCQ